MAYVWAGIAILIIWGIARIVRWWNLPEVAKARAARRTRRVMIRRGLLKPEALNSEPGKVVEVDDPEIKKRRFLFWRRKE
jgi:hypothetical protein